MGEKGNDPAGLVAAVAGAAEPSVIEKVTTTTTQTIVGAGEDVLAKVRDKAVDHGADAIIEGARGRLRPKDSADDAPGTAADDEGTGDAPPRA